MAHDGRDPGSTVPGARTELTQRQPFRCRAIVCAMLALIAACSAPPGPDGLPDEVDYNWHVRPILSENCFACHGPDEEGLEAGLRLDLRVGAIAELPESPGRFAVVPGDAAASELIRRVSATDPDVRMPPPSTHKVLDEKQVAILERWIDDGAEYRPHWAFIPPVQPNVPETVHAGLVSNQVDRFVFRKLESAGLSPSPGADKQALVNRLYLTLTGLPPSLDVVDAFIADDSEDAYERIVDELLDSPRYAEHMASYWLDLARWSESDGFLDDHHDRFLWPWRDWLIDAFERNMPFDEFGTWQLAGDLLPSPTREQVLATAFLRVGKRTTENGAIDEEYKAEYMIERTDNALGTAFMGLTLGCARCHDHRYDPITQRDYYQLGAFFNSNDEPGHYAPGFSGIQGGPTLAWPSEPERREIAAAAARVSELEVAYRSAIAAASADAEASVEATLADGGAVSAVRRVLGTGLAAHYALESAEPAALTDLPVPRPNRIPPPSLIELARNPFSGEPPPDSETEVERQAREARELAARVPRNYNAEELYLSAAEMPGVPPAVIQTPIFADGVVGNALFFDETNKGFFGRDVGWYDRSDPFSIDFWFMAAASYDSVPVMNHMAENNSGRTGYKISIENGRLWVQLAHSPPADMIAVETVEPFPVGAWTHVTLTYDGSSRAAGVRLYLNGEAAEVRVDHDTLSRSILPWMSGDVFDPFIGLVFGTRFRQKAPVGSGLDEVRVYGRELAPAEVAVLHRDTVGEDATVGREALIDVLVASDSRVTQALGDLKAARAAHDELVTVVPQVLVMGDAPTPIPTHVLGRGVYSSPLDEVEPRGLESVMAWDESLPKNRLGLARWLFDPANPLTARVFVNRVWQMHFGQGIVETAEDFGSQGSIPTHPDLLDWLATEFVASGWDVKALHRLIVTSSTYRQASEVSDALQARDPNNLLYARGPRWRMTAEMVRDHALFVSGLLVGDVGGESVKPYQPTGIWNPLNSFYDYPEADAIPDDDHHRRTMYTFVKRNALHPALQIFDFMNRTVSIARRRTSNTPLQALNLMNDPQFVEAYRALAASILTSVDDEQSRIERLYRTVTRTTPSAAMTERLQRYFAEQRETYAREPAKADALLDVGVTESDADIDRVALAAFTNVAALVMNSPDAYMVR